VPKGSFYHYFGSKEAFGEALLEDYFADYLAEMDATFRQPGLSKAQQLEAYFRAWRDAQSFEDCQGKCLAVKLGAEVADLSESMRRALADGTDEIVDRLERTIASGLEDGSLSIDGDSRALAQVLYDMWLGASVMAKIHRKLAPLDVTMTATQRLLHA
jgi:TetR/AcrR family transcriptional repressor of nem operon